MATRVLGGRSCVYFLNNSASTNEMDTLSTIAGYIFKMIKKIKTAEKADNQSTEDGFVGTAVEDLKQDRDFIDIITIINDKYKSLLDNSIKNPDNILSGNFRYNISIISSLQVSWSESSLLHKAVPAAEIFSLSFFGM